MSVLSILARQQELVRTLLRGGELGPDDLLLLAEPIPAQSPTAADHDELLRLQQQADELELLLARRMTELRAARQAASAVPAQGSGSRYLDTAL